MPVKKRNTSDRELLNEILEVVHGVDKEVAAMSMRQQGMHENIEKLEKRVGIQNGRVTKIERIGLILGGAGAVLMAYYGGGEVLPVLFKIMGG